MRPYKLHHSVRSLTSRRRAALALFPFASSVTVISRGKCRSSIVSPPLNATTGIWRRTCRDKERRAL